LTVGLFAAAALSLQASRYLSGVSGCSIRGIASPVVREGRKSKGYHRAILVRTSELNVASGKLSGNCSVTDCRWTASVSLTSCQAPLADVICGLLQFQACINSLQYVDLDIWSLKACRWCMRLAYSVLRSFDYHFGQLICRVYDMSICRPRDLDLWPFDLTSVLRVAFAAHANCKPTLNFLCFSLMFIDKVQWRADVTKFSMVIKYMPPCCKSSYVCCVKTFQLDQWADVVRD